MTLGRASGILIHPTSLPGRYGIGDLGEAAFDLCRMLADASQTYWQVLPLGPTGYGDSPYQSFSAFAGNTLLISPDKLVEDGLVGSAWLNDLPVFPAERVDYGGVYDWKTRLLAAAWDGFRNTENEEVSTSFRDFCKDNLYWLDDYALYRALKNSRDHRAWYEWPDDLRLRDEKALTQVAEELAEQVDEQKFYQFIFFRQWAAVRAFANALGIKVIGDIPIFVARDSADVWRHQDQFKLNADGSPKVVAGVPPDYFSSTGQLWGNPLYDWDAMRRDGFGWWNRRMRAALAAVDVIRLDHFRGFAGAWEVPGGDRTAEYGRWVNAPGEELFESLHNDLGEIPIIAEDLGVITADVEKMRDRFDFPGIRILQYAFGGDAANHDLPHNYIRNCVAYTGTHDNDTAVGWFASRKGESRHERDSCLRYLASDGVDIHWEMIRAVWASVADTAMVPMQDVLGLGNEARMNYPGSASGNWQWRLPEDALTSEIIERLRLLTETYGR